MLLVCLVCGVFRVYGVHDSSRGSPGGSHHSTMEPREVCVDVVVLFVVCVGVLW